MYPGAGHRTTKMLLMVSEERWRVRRRVDGGGECAERGGCKGGGEECA